MHALSIPTWVIHISSVVEWIAAIWFIWTYGEVSRNRAWWALSFAMLPALVSAMCACTWHFFDNAESLEWLVTMQAAMTLFGNFTLLAAAWWVWRSTQGFAGVISGDSRAQAQVADARQLGTEESDHPSTTSIGTGQ